MGFRFLSANEVSSIVSCCEWKDEKMKRWKDEKMKTWKDEKMKRWKDEKMKRWKDEKMKWNDMIW
jgi:hypothetical protein